MTGLTVRVLTLATMPVLPVLTRLGYRKDKFTSDAALRVYGPRIEKAVRETRLRVFSVEKPVQVSADCVEVGGYRFTSHLAARHLAGSTAAFVLGASAVREDMQALESLESGGDLQQAVLLDAVLSEKADYAMDFLEKELAHTLRPRGFAPGQRFSCGYGDFGLEHQDYFYQTLEFAQYGIRINERHVLDPEKTVTALLPVVGGAG